MPKKGLCKKWVGLVEVQQLEGVNWLGENRGAHVTVIAWCENESDYETVVECALNTDGLKMISTEKVEEYEEEFRNLEADESFIEAVAKVNPQNPVEFLTFHTFPLEFH